MDPSEHINILNNWQDYPMAVVTRTLEVLYKTYDTSQQDSHSLVEALDIFQKELGSAKASEQTPQWFQYSVLLKKRFEVNLTAPTMRQRQRMMREEQRKLKERVVNYPPGLLDRLDQADQKRVKMLYRTFTAHIEGCAPDGQMGQFVREVLSELYKHYPIKYSPKGQLDYGQISTVFSSICIRFEKKLSIPAKKLMLEGKISPEEVAQNNLALYYKAEVRKEMERTQNAELLQTQSKFYTFQSEMPQGKGEQCKLCHCYSAFCGQMIQTRSADEPMTRFMYCYDCKGSWRE